MKSDAMEYLPLALMQVRKVIAFLIVQLFPHLFLLQLTEGEGLGVDGKLKCSL